MRIGWGHFRTLYRLVDMGTNECPVCYAREVDAELPECGHRFCRSCLEAWSLRCFQMTCPMCRCPSSSFRRVCDPVEDAWRAYCRITNASLRWKDDFITLISVHRLSLHSLRRVAPSMLRRFRDLDADLSKLTTSCVVPPTWVRLEGFRWLVRALDAEDDGVWWTMCILNLPGRSVYAREFDQIRRTLTTSRGLARWSRYTSSVQMCGMSPLSNSSVPLPLSNSLSSSPALALSSSSTSSTSMTDFQSTSGVASVCHS